MTTPQARATTALQAGFIADSLTMPVHWFYDPAVEIPKFHPEGITGDKFVAPNLDIIFPYHEVEDNHAFMTLVEPKPEHNGKSIMGDVILRRNASNWRPHKIFHPHGSLPAGGNTTNACVARHLLRTLAGNGGAYDKNTWLEAYVAFMTDEKQAGYNDSFVEKYHQHFFAKFASGIPKDQCADTSEASRTIGAFTLQPALILAELSRDQDVERVKKVAREHLFTTAPHEELSVVLGSLVELIHALVYKRPENADEDRAFVQAALKKALECQGHNLDEFLKAEKDTDVVEERLYCDISMSWPTCIYAVAKYAQREDGAKKAVLANLHFGGENMHRGMVVGVLAALVNPNCDGFFAKGTGLADQLVDGAELKAELQQVFKSA